LLTRINPEHDPEENVTTLPASDEDDSDASDESFDAREHYAPVSKSALRKSKPIALGPQYQGTKIARAALEVSDEESNFPSVDGENDVSGDEEEQVEGETSQDEVNGDYSDLEEDDFNVASDAEPESQFPQDAAQKSQRHRARTELRNLMSREQQSSATALLAQAKKEDVEKGRGVKRQRATYDALLGTRMKLQKTLIGVNTLVGTAAEPLSAANELAQEDLRAAEQAAFTLWESLDRLRVCMSTDGAGSKIPQIERHSVSNSTAELWDRCLQQERDARPARDLVLEKWSKKVQGPVLQSDRGRLNQERQATIVDVLQEQLSNIERLVKKTHAPRSCAPLQSSRRVVEDAQIYDDADFYGLLLKELLEQKSHDSVAASSIDIGFQMRRDNKTKRNVDTKASKGRKIRYTVQEKLQNFMAPEMRATWEERQADELFGSLFGHRPGLAEVEDALSADEDFDPLEAGLVMFRKQLAT
jgi:protein AATF/BFR2